MKYKFYTTSESAWQAMMETIQGAKQYIFLESFILIEDELTKKLLEAIKDRAAAGVKVKIIVDRVGNFWFGRLSVDEFIKNGIEILFFSRLLNRNHRKILVVDGQTAFIGGVNIHGSYAKWTDLHVRLNGKFLIKKITKSFATVYSLAGGADPQVIRYLKRWRASSPRHAIYHAKTFLIEHWPFRRSSTLSDYYKHKIAEAKDSIVIVTPYFIPHRWLIGSLRQAAKRGVLVEVLIPQKTDSSFLDAANRIFTEELTGGIKFLFLPEMNHAKVLLIDGKEGMIGSNNIDARSFDFNLETGIVFQQKDMVRDLKEILDKWRKSAVLYGEMQVWRPWYYYFLKFLIKLIQPGL
ncbi:MAG: phosphatidylserine/phosphatidylglycerophosphate/cardiolipin synthase family protein [bacterium]|nr:phosphatidylserine/phosphatidylglycerophosphate/cardiolipin synthase family protein [bacterium]